jgi:hypothetical protein
MKCPVGARITSGHEQAARGTEAGGGGEKDPPQHLELVPDYDQLEIFGPLGSQSQDS